MLRDRLDSREDGMIAARSWQYGISAAMLLSLLARGGGSGDNS